MREFLADMAALLINFGTEQFMPFLGWLSQRVLFVLARLDVQDVVIIGVTLFAGCSLLDRIRRHSFFDSRPYGIPYWVLCHEYRRSTRRCATVREMEEGPSGSAIRSLIPSHRELLRSKAVVVSVAETPGQ
jgi:hypothetical protein